MGAWRSYDDIAERYDTVWSARFEKVARQIAALVSPCAGDRVLDIGTGTGIVPGMLGERGPRAGLVVACDRSEGMLLRARDRVAGVRVLVADATALPFADESFHVATASFVLSHIRDYPKALEEARRVLKSSGRFAASSWAPPSDPYSTAWDECLAGFVDKSEGKRSVAEVVPWEEHFSQEGVLETALESAGFAAIVAEVIDVECCVTVEQFIEDRELSSGGRWARHVLGAEGWARARAAAHDLLQARFRPGLRCQRRAFIATARKP